MTSRNIIPPPDLLNDIVHFSSNFLFRENRCLYLLTQNFYSSFGVFYWQMEVIESHFLRGISINPATNILDVTGYFYAGRKFLCTLKMHVLQRVRDTRLFRPNFISGSGKD